ncbi:MAG: hypothetical protein RR860_07965, partial [Janthinobacterium sp.]
MLHSSRKPLESRVCRSLRKAALYGAAQVWRCHPIGTAMVFSYYYYRFFSAYVCCQAGVPAVAESGRQAFAQQAGGRRLVRAVG